MRDTASGWIQLNSAELFLLWSAGGFGELPIALDVPAIGRTPRRRAELIAAADAALAARNLGTVGSPARDLAGYLAALAAPEYTVDVQVSGQGTTLSGMAASGSSGAAAAAVAGSEVRIGPLAPAGMLATVLDAVPDVPAGAGRGANVRVEDYRRACEQGARFGNAAFTDVLREAGLRLPETNTVLRAVSGKQGAGQIGATVRTTRSRVRTPAAVHWLDSDEGRYSVRLRGEWVVVTPVDLPRLHSMAEEMLTELR